MTQTPPAAGDRARSQRVYTVTARVTVDAEADLADPFARFAIFRALVEHLTDAPVELRTPFGAASARIDIVTAAA